MTIQEFQDKYGLTPHKDILRGDLIASAALITCPKHEPKVTTYGVETCQECQREAALSERKTPLPEMVPEYIKEEREKYVTDQIQSHRQGELSREFVEAYPEKIAEQVKAGVLTKEEVRKSKNVWKNDIPNWEYRKRKIKMN